MEILKKAVRGQNRAALPVPKSVRVYPSEPGAATECAPKTCPLKMAAAPQKVTVKNSPVAPPYRKPIA